MIASSGGSLLLAFPAGSAGRGGSTTAPGAAVSFAGHPVSTASSLGSFRSGASPARSSAAADLQGLVRESVNPSATTTPALTVTPTSGPVGTLVTFNATYFAHTSAFSITWSVGTACSGTTDSHGNFTCNFQIPPTSGGVYVFSGVDAKGHDVTVNFDVLTTIQLTPATGLVGTLITISGTGFNSKWVNQSSKTGPNPVHFPVTVTYPGGTACTTHTIANGSFSCTFTIPNLAHGNKTFKAVSTNATPYNASAPFFVLAGLSVGPTYGSPGASVTFAGTGYVSAGTVNVTWALGAACGGKSQTDGVFSCTYTIPIATAGGPYNFTGKDNNSSSAKTVFTVSDLTISPPAGAVGTNLTFTMIGFAPEVPLVLRGAGTDDWCAGDDFNSSGGFVCKAVAPAVGAGAHVFTASDNFGETAQASFTIEPTLELPSVHGPAGESLTFSGSGFGTNQSVAVTWVDGKAGDQTACSAGDTGSTGSFSCTFALPSTTPGGSHTFTATDAAGNFATIAYTVSGLTMFPGYGPVKASSNLTGVGFAPGATYAVSLDGKAIASCPSGTVSANGTFACVVKIPWEPVGEHTIAANDGAAGDSASTIFNVTPKLTVNSTRQIVGAGLSFNASGFWAHDAVNLSWFNGTANVLLCTSTTVLGSTNCTLTGFPGPTPAGTYEFTAVDTHGDTASTFVTIVPHLKVSPKQGTVGSLIYLNASGFAPKATFNISSPLGPACQGTTTSTGLFNCTFQIPSTAAGTYNFSASDSQGDEAYSGFTVGPTLEIGPTSSGPVGSLVSFVGAGFIASGTVNVRWVEKAPSSTTVTACTNVPTNAEGAFVCSYSIPTQPPGTYTFTATDSAKVPNKQSVTFSIVSSLSVNPTSGPVGSTVTFTGEGFPVSSGSTTVTVQVSWGAGLACAGATNTVGTFECSYVVGSAYEGIHSFAAVYENYSAKAQFEVLPTLLLTPSSGPVGSNLAFQGTGFAASESIQVLWMGTIVACSATTDVAGGFNCTYALPNATYGPHVFYAEDLVQANATFTVTPQLIVTPSSGLSGTPVTLTATGFAGNTTLTITWSGGDVTVCSTESTAVGSLVCSFTVPSSTTGGLYSFTAEDALGHTAVASFSVSTSLVISPNHGPAGTTVTFTGSGFAPSSALSVTWGQTSGSVCSASTTNASGEFTCVYTIPAGTAGGSYTFTAQDHSGNTATATFVVTFLKVTPSGATAGSTVTFSAGGFASLSHMKIAWGTVQACNGTSTTSGTFSCPYTIPSGTAPGPYTFTATDAVGDAASTVFTVFGVPSVSVPAANRTGADVGESVTFSTTASGGSGTYTSYTWSASSASLGCTIANSASIVCVPTAAGTSYTVSVYVTDSNGVDSSTSTSAEFQVSTDPVVSAPTSTPSGSVDVGQSVTFSVTASGGHGTLSYAWSGLPANCSGTGASITCVPAAPVADTHITVVVTDGNDFSVPSATLVFTVYGDPTVSVPTPSRGSADVGQEVTFSAVASGGSEGFSYTWFGLSHLGCSGSTANVTCVPTTAYAGAEIWVNVTDSNGFRVESSQLAYTVFADPTVTTPTANRTSVDLGESVTFTTSGAGGSGSLAFTWHNLPAGCVSTSSVTISCTPSATVTAAAITVTVTDSNGFMVTSAALTFSVYADPSASLPTASPSSTDVNQSVTFTVTVTGGSGGLTVVWSGLPTGCTGTTAAVQCSAGAPTPGTYSISARVTDSNGYSSTSPTLAFLVDPDPVVGTPSSSVSSSDVGQTVKFTVTPTLGSGGYTYVWWDLPDPCTGTTTATVTCTPAAAIPLAKIYVTVKDSNGFTVTSGTLDYTVYSDPAAATPVAAPTTADQGQNATISTVITGGSGGGSYNWVNLPGGCTPSGADVACVGLAAGTFSITVTYTDSNGVSSTSPALAFTVSTDPSVTTPKATPSSVDVGQKVVFTTTESGGYGTMTYTWANLPSGCTGTTTTTVTCTPTAAAQLSVTVTVKDGNGFLLTSTPVVFTVYTTPTVTLTVSPGSVLQGHSIEFTGTVSGGSGGLSFTWTGLPGGCTAPTSGLTLSCTPSSSGTFLVTLTATDSNGGVGSANTTVTVNPTFLGLPAAEGYAVLAGGIVAALVVLIALALIVRRRRRRGTAPLPWTPGPTAPPGPEAAPPVTTWTPPPTTPPPPAEGPEEPSPWELPEPEPGPEPTAPAPLPPEEPPPQAEGPPSPDVAEDPVPEPSNPLNVAAYSRRPGTAVCRSGWSSGLDREALRTRSNGTPGAPAGSYGAEHRPSVVRPTHRSHN